MIIDYLIRTDVNTKLKEEYLVLIKNILKQGINDYIKLQNNKWRTNKDSELDFENSIDMFFDETYRYKYIVDEDDNPMNTKQLISLMKGTAVHNMKEVQKNITRRTKDYWIAKQMNFIKIPKTISLNGEVFAVSYRPIPEIDFCNKIIYIRKSNSEKDLLSNSLKILLLSDSIDLSEEDRNKLSENIYLLFKINNIFFEDIPEVGLT